MSPVEYSQWSDRRASLFPVNLDARTRAALDNDVQRADYATQLRALEAYARNGTSKGFWLDKYAGHVRTASAIDTPTRAPADSLAAAAAQRHLTQSQDAQAQWEQSEEVLEYNALDPSWHTAATSLIAGGVLDGMSRAHRLVAIMLSKGQDCERWRGRSNTRPRCENATTDKDFAIYWAAQIALLRTENKQLRDALTLANGRTA